MNKLTPDQHFIDATLSWVEMAVVIEMVFTAGTNEDRETARQELRKMGRLADAYVSQLKEAK
jgi:hypothetical protein